MENLFWIGVVGALIALLFAWSQARRVKQFSEGTPAMEKIAAAIRRGLADGTVDPTADVKTLYYNTYDSILGVIQRMSIGVPSVHELDGHARIDALCEQFTRAFAAPPKQ